VVRRFGAGVLNPDGSVHRARLAELAFGSKPSRVQELNQIVHPAVIGQQQEWMEQLSRRDPHGVAMVEAALILEAGMAENLDHLVVVTCHPEQRIDRLARRLKVDEETAAAEVSRRMAAQLPDEEKVKAADYVIDNSGSLDETRRQVQEVYAKLRREANCSLSPRVPDDAKLRGRDALRTAGGTPALRKPVSREVVGFHGSAVRYGDRVEFQV